MGQIFDPQRVHAAARRALGLPHRAMVRTIVEDLRGAYPQYIESNPAWVMNITGGATGTMALLHCSLSEYIMMFGTPIGTEGYSGRYLMEIHDFVLTGQMWTYTEADCGERIVSRPGDAVMLARGTGKGYRLLKDTWLLEYGRGPVPTMLPVGLMAALVSLDLPMLWKTLSVSTRLTCRSLARGKV